MLLRFFCERERFLSLLLLGEFIEIYYEAFGFLPKLNSTMTN